MKGCVSPDICIGCLEMSLDTCTCVFATSLKIHVIMLGYQIQKHAIKAIVLRNTKAIVLRNTEVCSLKQLLHIDLCNFAALEHCNVSPTTTFLFWFICVYDIHTGRAFVLLHEHAFSTYMQYSKCYLVSVMFINKNSRSKTIFTLCNFIRLHNVWNTDGLDPKACCQKPLHSRIQYR